MWEHFGYLDRFWHDSEIWNDEFWTREPRFPMVGYMFLTCSEDFKTTT